MGRVIEVNPVTRIEGHAKVRIELDDAGKVVDASMHVLEFRGFERFVQGMQVELMPTLTTRICGTCPHAHHLAAAKAIDRVFSVTPPRSAVLLRQLLNAGSIIHSHAIHFFALAGPDLFVAPGAPPAQRSILSLMRASPELVRKGLRLRSLGQRIAEAVGGRGTHPVTCVAGGMSSPLSEEDRGQLKRLAAEALDLARFALEAAKAALAGAEALLTTLPLEVHDMGTVNDGALAFYDGKLRVTRTDGSLALEFDASAYADLLVEEAGTSSYAKRILFRDPSGGLVPYRVGPLARLNCIDRIDTPNAQAELEEFRERWGKPTPQTVLGHHARLIELYHHAEKAVMLLDDPEITSPEVRAPITAAPVRGIAHVEAPRGVLIHDYDVDEDGRVKTANFLVATQHNIFGIDAGVRMAAERLLGDSDEALLGGVEFAIRCYDPCLSCSTHQVGKMPLDVTVVQAGHAVRRVTR